VRRVGPVAARWLVLGAIAVGLTACFFSQPSIESVPYDQRAQSATDQIRSLDLSPRQADPVGTGGTPRPSRAAVYLGNTGDAIDPRPVGGGGPAGEGYDLNFENAPVTTVAKVVLGDILGVGYTIDPRVQGTITLASGRPVAKSDVLFVLESALRMSNVALVHDREGYRLVPADGLRVAQIPISLSGSCRQARRETAAGDGSSGGCGRAARTARQQHS